MDGDKSSKPEKIRTEFNLKTYLCFNFKNIEWTDSCDKRNATLQAGDTLRISFKPPDSTGFHPRYSAVFGSYFP